MVLPWKCPHCGKKLKWKQDGGLYCLKNHQFDKAKEGYFHLLPVQAMKSKVPGDSKEMLLARRAFLQAGYYQVFGDALRDLCLQHGEPLAAHGLLPKKAQRRAAQEANVQVAQDAVHIVDAGCGEGWYDRAILAGFSAQNRPCTLAGFDIAKEAVRLAAKSNTEALYAVGSSFAQPVQSAWADIAINIFSPMASEEFTRVLRVGGKLIYAVPGARHLFGLKEILYDKPYENAIEEMEYEGFQKIDSVEVTHEITISDEMIQNVFAMTPYYWKTPREGAERLAKTQTLTTEIAFRFLVFEKQ